MSFIRLLLTFSLRNSSPGVVVISLFVPFIRMLILSHSSIDPITGKLKCVAPVKVSHLQEHIEDGIITVGDMEQCSGLASNPPHFVLANEVKHQSSDLYAGVTKVEYLWYYWQSKSLRLSSSLKGHILPLGVITYQKLRMFYKIT